MKKKRFYNNKKRNTKWTEPVRGRKIDFSDKYIDAGTGSDKFDKMRPKKRKKRVTADSMGKFFKNLIIVFCGFLIVSAGYMVMDLYMERNAMPSQSESSDETDASIGSVSLKFQSITAQPLSLDNGVVLDSIISSAVDGGYSSVAFDLKRDDGTIGYESSLAAVQAYAAVSYAAADLEGSVAKLLENDLLPVARISCYKDNIAPVADVSAAVTDGSSVYKDSDGNTYLNPESDTVYNYIKNIIEEAKSMGITVFVLDNTDLPEEVSDDYDDGFEQLAKQLYADLGDEIKLVEAVEVEVYSSDADSLSDYDDDESDYYDEEDYDSYGDEYDEYSNYEDETKEYTEDDTDTSYEPQTDFEELLAQSIDGNIGDDAVYYITTDNEQAVLEYLIDNSITDYIINVTDSQQ